MSPTNQQIHDTAEKTIKQIHKLMRDNGYQMYSFTQSACTTFRYGYADPLRDFKYELSIHHGRGKWGPGKVILSFNERSTNNAIFEMDTSCRRNDPNSPVDWTTGDYTEAGARYHEEMTQNILKYIQTL